MRERFFLILVICFLGAFAVRAGGAEAATYKKGFSYKKLPPAVKRQMKGKSYPVSGAKISLSGLRIVTVRYYNFKGKKRTGTLIVNKKIAKKTAAIFYELYKICYRIERMEPVDKYDADDEKSMEANNTSAFNYRTIAGSRKLSMHGRGLAIDLNPRINPCLRNGKTEPSNGKAYRIRNRKKCRGKYKKYMILKNSKVVRIFKKYGFSWGGDWKSLKDYQHFEYKNS